MENISKLNTISDIIYEDSFGENRIAFFSQNKLIECWLDRKVAPSKISQIHLAKVERILEGVNRVILKLYDGEVVSSRCYKRFPKVGDIIPITIISDRNKQKPTHAVLNYFLKGSYTILTPHIKQIGISKTIINQKHRDRIKTLSESSGISKIGGIIRSKAEKVSDEELLKDFEFLLSTWEKIREKINLKEPTLIFSGFNLKSQAILSCPNASFIEDEMSNEFNNRDGFDQLVSAFCSKSFNIPNGGKIFYEKTNALTAIDIDSSDRNLSNGGINQFSKEALLLSLNLIRLRNASGQISIDLPRLNQQQMKSRIIEAKEWSKVMFNKTTIHGNSKGGIFELTCKRERTPIDEYSGGISALTAYECLRKLSLSKSISDLYLTISKETKKYIDKNLKNDLNKVKLKLPKLSLKVNKGFNSEDFEISS